MALTITDRLEALEAKLAEVLANVEKHVKDEAAHVKAAVEALSGPGGPQGN